MKKRCQRKGSGRCTNHGRAHGFLHYAFAKTLSEMLSAEEADHLTRMAIEEYGRLAAASVTEHLEEQGKPVTLMNFRYGKDLPLWLEYTPIAMPEDKPAGKISKITYCPLAATWKKLPDGCRLADTTAGSTR